MPTPNPAPPEPVLDQTVVALAGHMAALDPGDLAALRRPGRPGDPGPAVFWRLHARLDLDRLPGDVEGWLDLARALAILTPTGRDDRKPSAHEGARRLGKALHEAGYSELRFARLLAAPRATRRDLAVRACRMLAREGSRFDTRQLARLILFGDMTIRRALARDYYGVLDTAERGAAARTEGNGSDA